MSTGSRRPPSPPPDLWPEDEVTTIDAPAFVEALNEVQPEDPLLRAHDPPPGEYETPVDVPFCHECGAVVVLDDFTDYVLHAFPSHCMRARSGRWWWCSKFRNSVTYVPE